MRFTKIRFDGATTALAWTERHDGSTATHELESRDLPRPEFKSALDVFLPHALKLCELPAKYGEACQVLSVSISTNAKSGRRGLVITVKRPVDRANSPFTFSTPHVAEVDEERQDGEKSGVFLDGMLEALEALEEEASLFTKGQRAQGELFGKNSASTAAASDDTAVDDDTQDAIVDDGDDDDAPPKKGGKRWARTHNKAKKGS